MIRLTIDKLCRMSDYWMEVAIVLLVLFSTGCSTIATRSQRALLVRTAMERVYDRGGAKAVSLSIDALVLDGKLTPEQAKMVKKIADSHYKMMIAEVDKFVE